VAKVITFPGSSGITGGLITFKPLFFRRASWDLSNPAQVSRTEAEAFEKRRVEAMGKGRPVGFTPSYLELKGSLSQTLTALFRSRDDESRMRQIYFLAGLMEVATGLSHHILRSDLIRRVFSEIQHLANKLGVQWLSSNQGFLLPVYFSEEHSPESWSNSIEIPLPRSGLQLEDVSKSRLKQALSQTQTLKDLISALRNETDAQFDLLSRFFVFYLPHSWTRGLMNHPDSRPD
jgi:hypothetical protein